MTEHFEDDITTLFILNKNIILDYKKVLMEML